MGDQRGGGISWTDETWNVVRGCSRVSAGCGNCYAERSAVRSGGPGGAYDGLVQMTKSGPRWTGEVRLVPHLLDEPLRWRRPRLVFVNAMSDLFHEKLTNHEIAAVFGVMAASQNHVFQTLTKRSKRMREWFAWIESHDDPAGVIAFMAARVLYPASEALRLSFEHHHGDADWPLKNVWLGVSVEHQDAADERVEDLVRSPARVRWLSVEPLLGLVDLKLGRKWTLRGHDSPTEPSTKGLHWIVCGGESGPGARPMKLEWALAVRDQCAAAGLPFHFKQWGAFGADGVRRSKHDNGRELDGVVWGAFPAAALQLVNAGAR